MDKVFREEISWKKNTFPIFPHLYIILLTIVNILFAYSFPNSSQMCILMRKMMDVSNRTFAKKENFVKGNYLLLMFIIKREKIS